ncbi:MAG: DUF2304 domain-containing protein [Solirubrobacteraceae bacterium]
MDRLQLVSILAASALFFAVLELVRRRRLLERYALLWLLAALVILGLAVWRGALERMADLFGIVYAPNSLFFIALGFIVVLLLHFSAAVSRLTDQSKVLAQRLALLEERVRGVEALPAITAGSPDEELPAIAELERTR